jgi:4-diphosphocytidyl-2-C-methyl-D-erythritol kinase
MTPLTEVAPAKINVCLFVGPRRESDGRHELVTVFQAVSLCDDLVLERGERDCVVCPGVEGVNLAQRALEAFRIATGWDGPPVRIRIEKKIPVAGGMAGGSADAAATLRLLADHAGGGDEPTLMAIAAGLGADVPAQLRPGRHLGTGAGEVLEPLPAVEPYHVLIVASPHRLSTADVFARARELQSVRSREDLDERLAAVRAALPSLGDELVVNDLQDAAIDLCPSVNEALGRVRDAGADHALVSGSGPTVVGLFADPDDAAAAASKLGGSIATRTLAAHAVEGIGNNAADS